MSKNGQKGFKNFAVFTSQDFKVCSVIFQHYRSKGYTALIKNNYSFQSFSSNQILFKRVYSESCQTSSRSLFSQNAPYYVFDGVMCTPLKYDLFHTSSY